MPTYDARIIPKSDVPSGHIREQCSAHRSRITTIGRNKGQQIRIERPTADEVALGLYTVIDLHTKEPDIVFLGYRVPESVNRDLSFRF